MRADDVRFLFAYDRWATRKVLAAAGRLRRRDWPGETLIGRSSLGQILLHQLGAHQRWRSAFEGLPAGRDLERGPMPSVRELTAAWEAEWIAMEALLAEIDDAWLAKTHDGVARWQMLAHLANHGTQHRSEAAALLTALRHSPRELDMIHFAHEVAAR